MADTNEHKSKKAGTKIGAVIVLILAAIVFLPAGGIAVYQGLFNSSKVPSFGSYDGKKITYEANSRFVTTASNIMEQYRNYGIQVTEQYYYYIFNQAFNQVIQSLAYESAIGKSGYKVSVDAINRTLVSLPAFQDENGKFSQKIYNQVGQSQINTLRKNIEESLEITRYSDDLFGSSQKINGSELYGLKSTKAEEDFINAMAQEKHSFQLAAFDTANFPEEQAISYAKENVEKFTRYDISAISVDSESEAKSILKQLNANEITFEDAVADKSAKYYTDSNGKLSAPYRYQISDMVENEENVSQIINLSKDSLSQVIKTKHGYSIFRNDGEEVLADFSNADLVSVVMNYMKENESGYIENYYINIASDFASEAALSSFNRACSVYNVEAVNVDAFPLNYGNSSFYQASASQSEISEIANNTQLLQQIFSLKKDEFSSPLVVGSKVVVLKCTEIQNETVENSDSYLTNVKNVDSSSAVSTLMASDKVENNFIETYFNYFMNNNSNSGN